MGSFLLFPSDCSGSWVRDENCACHAPKKEENEKRSSGKSLGFSRKEKNETGCIWSYFPFLALHFSFSFSLFSCFMSLLPSFHFPPLINPRLAATHDLVMVNINFKNSPQRQMGRLVIYLYLSLLLCHMHPGANLFSKLFYFRRLTRAHCMQFCAPLTNRFWQHRYERGFFGEK